MAFFEGNKVCKSNDAHYCDTVKTEQELTKKRQICKSHKNFDL